MGDQQVFVIPDQVIAHVLEFPAFLILGALCGVVAFLFTRATIRLARFADNMPVPRFALPAMAGIAVAVTGLWMPEALGVGYEATSEALAGNYALDFLIGLLVVKFALSALSQAFGFGGGVFSTSLVIGAAFGTAFGIIAISVSPVESSASTVYTIVGMGSLAAAVMGSPISTILMMFEMTSSYEVTIAVMLGAITSTAMFHLLGSGSFFNAQLKRLGLEIRGGRMCLSCAISASRRFGTRKLRWCKPLPRPRACLIAYWPIGGGVSLLLIVMADWSAKLRPVSTALNLQMKR